MCFFFLKPQQFTLPYSIIMFHAYVYEYGHRNIIIFFSCVILHFNVTVVFVVFVIDYYMLIVNKLYLRTLKRERK